MSDYCKHGTLPTSCWICKCKEFEAENTELKALRDEKFPFDRDTVIERLEAENKALLELLIERDGGVHDADCKIHRPDIKRCNCGHNEVVALTKEEL